MSRTTRNIAVGMSFLMGFAALAANLDLWVNESRTAVDHLYKGGNFEVHAVKEEGSSSENIVLRVQKNRAGSGAEAYFTAIVKGDANLPAEVVVKESNARWAENGANAGKITIDEGDMSNLNAELVLRKGSGTESFDLELEYQTEE